MPQGSTDQGEQLERALLALLVESYPALWSAQELVLELADDPERFAERDAVAVAVRTLLRCGLARQVDGSYLATRAAVHAARLAD